MFYLFFFYINSLVEISLTLSYHYIAPYSTLCNLLRVYKMWHLRESIFLNLSKLRLLIATRFSRAETYIVPADNFVASVDVSPREFIDSRFCRLAE